MYHSFVIMTVLISGYEEKIATKLARHYLVEFADENILNDFSSIFSFRLQSSDKIASSDIAKILGGIKVYYYSVVCICDGRVTWSGSNIQMARKEPEKPKSSKTNHLRLIKNES